MQQPEEPNPFAASFASLLSSMISSDKKETAKPDARLDAKSASKAGSKSASPWEEEGEPASELVTLSYENALRTHARYRPTADPISMPSVTANKTASVEANAAPLPPAPAVASSVSEAPPVYAPARSTAPLRESYLKESHLKSASITIRMSEAECERLRQRAAEAGMTISAYLRSCTFEAETLRAQVKEVMTELRAATVAAAASATHTAAPVAPPEPPRRGFFDRLLARPQSLEHALRA